MRRQVAKEIKSCEVPSSFPDGDSTLGSCTDREKRSFDKCDVPGIPPGSLCSSSSQESEVLISSRDKILGGPGDKVACITSMTSGNKGIRTMSNNETKKKAKKDQRSQLSIMSFFQKSSILSNGVDNGIHGSTNQADVLEPNDHSNEPPLGNNQSENLSQSDSPQQDELKSSAPTCDKDEVNTCPSEKNNVALLEWQRIQQMMQNSIPLCKGHKEPCVARVVKKQGPNFGRRFYVCARAEVFRFNIHLSLGILSNFLSFFLFFF